MSTSPTPKEKRHYASVLRHTLHVVRTRGKTVEFCGESALSEKSSVQKLVHDWSEDLPIAAIVAIDPEPVWWHLGDATEAHALRTDVEVRRFAGRLPHRLRGPLEVIGCKAADGTGVSSEGEERWLLGVAGGEALAGAAAEAIERGIVTAALGSATLGGVAAAATTRQLEGAGSVRLWAIGQKHSHVFTVGLHGIDSVVRCATGFDAIFAAAQQVFGAKSQTEAAQLFFSEKPPDSGAAEGLVSVLAPQLQSVLGATPCPGSASFACTALTNREAWFGRAMAGALGMSYWSPGADCCSEDLQLNFPRGWVDRPSLSLLGTLHLAATHAGGRTAWHPSWGLISRTPVAPAAAQEIRPSRNSAVAPALPPEPRSVNVPAAVTEHVIPARAPASVANVPDARLEANGESKQISPASTCTGERKTSVPPPARDVPAEVSVVPVTRVETHGGPHPPSLMPAPLKHVPTSEAKSLSLVPASLSSVATEPAESKPAAPLPSLLGPAMPPREPTVIVVHRSGYWPVFGIALAVVGAVLWGKLYLDAEAVKTAAAHEKRAAEQAMKTAEREIAAAVEQVRRVSELAAQSEVQAREQAARSELQVRELSTANAREIERIRTEMEAARREAVAEARREAEEQTRQLLAPQLEVARAVTSPGILKITSVPAGADVHVDGRLAERAPASIEGLPPGRHSIKLTLAGHVPQEITADIIGSKTTDVGAIKLERATGAVAVSSSPDQLEFSLHPSVTPADADPLRRGRTPAEFNDLPTGEYVVQFRRAGWPERTERVTIERGATKSVATTFEGGTVMINSSPTGATVVQGGLLLGTTPLTVGDIPPRDVTYELSAPGYEPLKVGGTVVGGFELELNGTLLNLDRLVNADEVRTPPRPYSTTPLDLGRVPRSAPPYITVSFVVLPDGSLQEVKVLDAVDKKIEKRSIEAIAKWKFFPGVSHAGYPVKVRMSMPIPIASRG